MSGPFPLSQSPIFATWYNEHGGIGVTARTDATGKAFIGHHPLNAAGMPSGPPSEYPRSRFNCGVVAGYLENGETFEVWVDIEITKKGLMVRIELPAFVSGPRHISAKWGSELPPQWMNVRPISQWLSDIKAA